MSWTKSGAFSNRSLRRGTWGVETTVIQLSGRVMFDLEHEQSAQYSFTWLDAIAAVQAMTIKMSKDGYYERSATIFMENKVLVAEMALYIWRFLKMKPDKDEQC